MIDFVVKTAKKKGGKGMIFTSQSNDSKKNPLDYNTKTKFLKKFFPKANIVRNPKIKTAFDALRFLSDQGFKNVTMVVGGDRVSNFEKAIRPYINHEDPKKSYDFDHFEVVNSGERVEGVSGTDMRNHAKNDDFDAYKKGLPKGVSDKDAKAIYNAVRSGMNIKEDVELSENPMGLKGVTKSMLPKKTLHKIKRMMHSDKYKKAIKLYHQMLRDYEKNPKAFNRPGSRITNPKSLAMTTASQMVGISSREFKKVLDKKTRYN